MSHDVELPPVSVWKHRTVTEALERANQERIATRLERVARGSMQGRRGEGTVRRLLRWLGIV